MWLAAFSLGFLIIVGSLIAFAVSRFVRSKSAKAALLPEQTNWLDAERRRQSELKQADSDRSAVIKQQSIAVKQAEKALATARQEGTKRIDVLAPNLVLFEDRLETPQGRIVFENGPVIATVETSGSVVAGPKGPQDTRKCFITMTGTGITSVAECKPDLEAKARAFAAAAQNWSAAWPGVRDAAAEGVVRAEADLESVRANSAEATANAEAAFLGVSAASGQVDAARAAANVRYCPQCDRNVAVNPAGACPRGHLAAGLSEPRSDKKAASPAARVGFGKPDKLAIAGLVLGTLLLCGGVIGSPAPESSSVAERESESTSSAVGEKKPVPVAPVIKVAGPASLVSESADVTLTCTVTPESSTVDWSSNETSWTPMVKTGDSWEAGLKLGLGVNDYQVRATTVEGLVSTQTVSLTYEPLITMSLKAPAASVGNANVTLEGKVSPVCDLTINGKKYSPKSDGTFSFQVPLSMGANTIQVEAKKTSYKSASEQFTVERVESAAEFKKSCKAIKYSLLAKNPDALLGDRAYFKGKIFNISEDGTTGQAQIWVTRGDYDMWDDAVFVIYEGSIPWGEGDIIQVWGEIAGAMTGTNAFGGTISQPGVLAKYITK